jgi:hypothetical protein
MAKKALADRPKALCGQHAEDIAEHRLDSIN